MAARRPRAARRERRSLLERAAGLVIRHPKLVVAVWFVVLGALAAQGSGLASKIYTGPIFIEGSETEREHEISVQEFGSDSAMVVMLRGPEAALDRQGPLLVRRIDALPNTMVNSPWDPTRVIGGLKPKSGIAALVVSVGTPAGSATENVVEKIEHRVDRTLSGPVKASIAGGISLGDALRTSIEKAANDGEKLAIPVLLIVLLLVCRSFIAAAMPVVVGALVVAATKGVLDIAAGSINIDSFAPGAAGMLGLALGVDYSLLVVSRFREEREAGGDIDAAVERTVRATGRSVIPAGCGLVLAMLVSSQLLPGSVIASVSLSVTAASVLSVLSAIFATPAILMLVGRHLDRWSLPARRDRPGVVLRWTRRIASRPALVLAVVFFLFICAGWAFTLKTNIGTVSELPPNNRSRIEHEQVQRALGPGWIAPLEVVMASHQGPVTTARRLRALTRFQHRVEDDPGVATMAGFSSLQRSSEQFQKIGPGLNAQEHGIVRIDNGLSKLQAGTLANTSGFAEASNGAQQIGAALGETVKGSGLLANGLRTTAKGSEKLDGGLEQADTGSGKLAQGASKSSNGASRLAKALDKATERAGESSGSSRVLRNALRSGNRSLAGMGKAVGTSEERLVAALQSLQRMTSGRSDPQYAAAVAAVEEASRGLGAEGETNEETEAHGVKGGIEHAQSQFSLGLYLAARVAKNDRQSQEGVAKLAKASSKLDRGLGRLASSSEELSQGIAELSQGGGKLSPGLRELTDNAERLMGGLSEIGAGTNELAGGLGEGAQSSTQLTSAVGKLHSGTGRLRGPSGKGQFAQLTENSPGLFKSGYFFLAGLDGSKPAQRSQAGFLLNLGEGGSTARMQVIPRYDPNTAEARAARDRLQENAEALSREAKAEVLVGGVTPDVVDANNTLRERTPLTRIALSLVTILVLLFVTRSLALAVFAALLNLLTVSATFGLMSLFFNGALLGGPGYVDTVTIPAAIILVFGLAIDYEVFIFARMREEYVRTGSTATAITDGLGRSANVVTGAAMIMISVFFVFALSPVSTLRGLGTALVIGVFIDAFLIRFVIVPAAMTALGDRSWWIPRWLDRLLPGGAPPAARTVEE